MHCTYLHGRHERWQPTKHQDPSPRVDPPLTTFSFTPVSVHPVPHPAHSTRCQHCQAPTGHTAIPAMTPHFSLLSLADLHPMRDEPLPHLVAFLTFGPKTTPKRHRDQPMMPLTGFMPPASPSVVRPIGHAGDVRRSGCYFECLNPLFSNEASWDDRF